MLQSFVHVKAISCCRTVHSSHASDLVMLFWQNCRTLPPPPQSELCGRADGSDDREKLNVGRGGGGDKAKENGVASGRASPAKGNLLDLEENAPLEAGMGAADQGILVPYTGGGGGGVEGFGSETTTSNFPSGTTASNVPSETGAVFGSNNVGSSYGGSNYGGAQHHGERERERIGTTAIAEAGLQMGTGYCKKVTAHRGLLKR